MPRSIFHMISGWFRFQPGSKRVNCHSNLLWTSPLYLAQSSTSCHLSCLQGPSKRASRYKSLQTIVLDQGFSNEFSAREPSVSPKDLSPPLSKMVVCFYAFNCIRRHGAPEQYSSCLHMTTLSTYLQDTRIQIKSSPKDLSPHWARWLFASTPLTASERRAHRSMLWVTLPGPRSPLQEPSGARPCPTVRYMQSWRHIGSSCPMRDASLCAGNKTLPLAPLPARNRHGHDMPCMHVCVHVCVRVCVHVCVHVCLEQSCYNSISGPFPTTQPGYFHPQSSCHAA